MFSWCVVFFINEVEMDGLYTNEKLKMNSRQKFFSEKLLPGNEK